MNNYKMLSNEEMKELHKYVVSDSHLRSTFDRCCHVRDMFRNTNTCCFHSLLKDFPNLLINKERWSRVVFLYPKIFIKEIEENERYNVMFDIGRQFNKFDIKECHIRNLLSTQTMYDGDLGTIDDSISIFKKMLNMCKKKVSVDLFKFTKAIYWWNNETVEKVAEGFYSSKGYSKKDN